MPLAGLVFLTPAAGLVVLAGLVPLAALVAGRRRAAVVQRALGLPPPPARRARLLGIGAAALLLGLAAAQPALRSESTRRVRTDAAAFVVVDITRSMAAAGDPSLPTRLERARALAVRLRDRIDQVPTGVATLTDRVLPSLFPTGDVAAFDATVLDTLRVDHPPPRQIATVATDLGVVGDLETENFFGPEARRRLVVVLTDGESAPFSPVDVARELEEGPGAKLVLVRVGRPSERIYGLDGRPDPFYRSAPSGDLAALAGATGASLFDEADEGRVAAAMRRLLGDGATARRGLAPRTRSLASFVAMAALVPLALLAFGRRPSPRRGRASILWNRRVEA